MKTIFKIAILALLLAVAPSQCFALRSMGFVSKKEAKELGMDLRFKANGTNEVWVELEFKTEGKFREFRQVELQIKEGEKFLLGWAPLKEQRAGSGSVVIRFLANRAYLDGISLCVVVGDFGDTGWVLQVKDFVEPKKVR